MADLVKSAVRRLRGLRLCAEGREDGAITHLVVGKERRTLKLMLAGAWAGGGQAAGCAGLPPAGEYRSALAWSILGCAPLSRGLETEAAGIACHVQWPTVRGWSRPSG